MHCHAFLQYLFQMIIHKCAFGLSVWRAPFKGAYSLKNLLPHLEANSLQRTMCYFPREKILSELTPSLNRMQNLKRQSHFCLPSATMLLCPKYLNRRALSKHFMTTRFTSRGGNNTTIFLFVSLFNGGQLLKEITASFNFYISIVIPKNRGKRSHFWQGTQAESACKHQPMNVVSLSIRPWQTCSVLSCSCSLPDVRKVGILLL